MTLSVSVKTLATFSSKALPNLLTLTTSQDLLRSVPSAAKRLRCVKARAIHPAVIMVLQQRLWFKELSACALETAGRKRRVCELKLEYTPDSVVWRALAQMWLVERVADRVIVRVVRADSAGSAARDVRNMVFQLAGLNTGSTGIRDTDGDEEGEDDEAKWFRRSFGGCGGSSKSDTGEGDSGHDHTPATPLVVDVEVSADMVDAVAVAEWIQAQVAALDAAYVVVGHVGVKCANRAKKTKGAKRAKRADQ
ncbi:hypothetical protein GGF32_002964 [Allomyces javanicus]|nr:hypothetical protein GGF32_002964 [Allomyces javanicus]